MTQAIELGHQSRLISPPNPWVGCVIVKNGSVIGQGRTQHFGSDHAEVQAIKSATESLEGSTVYVTLEPCPHRGKTPPCTDALIEAKVKKVVIALLDPDHNVNGRGIETLKKAGIEVEVGLLKEEAKASLLPYLHHRKTGLPYCILKAAISMDGKIAAKNGSSIWITGPEAREDVHLMRAESQAILVGTNTALEDDPSLNVRDVPFKEFKQPLRVLVDASGKVSCRANLCDQSLAPTLIFTSLETDPSLIDAWKCKGCTVEAVPYDREGRGLDMNAILTSLGKRGVLQLLVEGGSKIFSTLIQEKLANKIILYMGSCLLGAEGISLFSQLNLDSMDEAIRMKLISMSRFGKDVRLDYIF